MALISILGAKESGVGTAMLAQKKGYEVFVSDLGTIEDSYREQLQRMGVRWEEGKHTESVIFSSDLVMKSPGIPDKAPIVKKIKDREIPIVSEIEFASRYTQTPIIAITGSNGKTTTTSLIHHVLTQSGVRAALGGNIGHSFAALVADDPDGDKYDCYVLELSSFQLDGIQNFRPHIAVLTNITPDHLDRYDYKFQNYVDSKFRIAMNQTPEDYLIFNSSDRTVRHGVRRHKPRSYRLPFSIDKKQKEGAYVQDDMFYVEIPGRSFSMFVSELSLRGSHNLMNAMAAAEVCLLMEVSDQDLKARLADFPPVEHRLEPVREFEGVEYINDSKATNVDSVYYALGSMTRPTVLILGGTDKGNDYSQIKDLVREKVKAIVCMGVDNSKIVSAFQKLAIPIVETASVKDAVNCSRSLAQPGDTVLLSPACASFDLFKNYEDRGVKFKKAVNSLI